MAHQLLLTYDFVTFGYDLGHSIDVIFFDFRKAFDIVNHRLLIAKLAILGVRDPLLGWICDFLVDRQMKVVVSVGSSDSVGVSSGVHQGSVLGAALFLIFINFIRSGMKSRCYMFADDLKLLCSSPAECLDDYVSGLSVLQEDIDRVFQVAVSWGLSFALEKCSRLHFSRHREPFAASDQLTISAQCIQIV